MGLLFLTALAGLLGYGLGQGVPRLVQRSGGLARRSQTNQLLLGLALLTPWLVGGLGLLLAVSQLSLLWLVTLAGYGVGMAIGRNKVGL